MNDNTISISVSEDEQEFIAGQLADGRFASESDILHAGLALLEKRSKVRNLRKLIAEGDWDFEQGDYLEFGESDDLTQFIVDNAAMLK